MSFQLSLSSAVGKRNINAFREALHSASDAEKLNKETKLSIFEEVCQTPGCHEFITECIRAGCDVNKVNPPIKSWYRNRIHIIISSQLNTEYQKRPVNFAAESLCSENIDAISAVPSTNLDATYEHHTPLNFLAKHITDANFINLSKCIAVLVERGADLNIPNKRDMTPISTILHNRSLNDDNKEKIIAILLDVDRGIDVDSYRKGEARKLLSERFPSLRLPTIRDADVQWNWHKLMAALRNEKEADFLLGLNSMQPNDLPNLFRESDGDETLLILAAKKDLTGAAERMLRLGADINYSVRQYLTPVEAACKYGHWKVLALFLKSPELNVHTAEPLLSITVRNIGEKTTNKCNYKKCFHLLLTHPGIDVDQLDMNECTALHYAVKYNNQSAILELLKRGAYIGVKNSFNRFSISEINPKILEKHLNNCVTTNPDHRSGDDNFEIIFDFTNFVPITTKQKFVDDMEKKDTKADLNAINICADEMAPIEYMSKSNELKHLMKHPLIASFLFLKWHRLATIFYINFILYSIFCVNILSYIMLCYCNVNTTETLSRLLWTMSLVLASCIFVRELFQMVLSPHIYFRNKENYLEITLVITVGMILSDVKLDESVRRDIAALTILLTVFELFILIGSLPVLSFSTHLVMLRTVTYTFMKSFLLYSIILVAFSLSFFTLLNEPRPVKSGQAGEEAEGDDFNKFENPGVSILKTVVMLTGEFDAASINFNLNAMSYFLFLTFVFVISTVLFNLLNGLAVSDTQAIKSEAELTNFIYRCELMARYEKILIGTEKTWW